jgi:hypothetical protein
MAELPPDLSRLGDLLGDAVARDGRRRARRVRVRMRLAVTALAALMTFAATVPSHLAPSERRPLIQLAAAPAFGATIQPTAGCDQPRGARFTRPRGCVVVHPPAQAAR